MLERERGLEGDVEVKGRASLLETHPEKRVALRDSVFHLELV